MSNNNQDKMDKGIESGLWIKPYFHFDTEEAWQSFCREMELPYIPQPEKRLIFTRSDIFKYAAVLVIVFGVFALITKPVQFTDTLTTKDQGKNIQLFDGSVIELAENTTIQYPVRSKDIVVRRVVVEHGKAVFRVKKNTLPFIVSAYPLEIKVTGTTFTIEKTTEGVFITQEEGRVEVRKLNESMLPVVLEKGGKIKMTGGEVFMATREDDFKQISQFTYAGIQKIEKLTRETEKKVAEDKPVVSLTKGLTYMMKDVIPLLEKTYKKQLRFKKKRKLKSKETVTLKLDKTLPEIIDALVKQGKVVAEPGKCADCFILSPPPKK